MEDVFDINLTGWAWPLGLTASLEEASFVSDVAVFVRGVAVEPRWLRDQAVLIILRPLPLATIEGEDRSPASVGAVSTGGAEHPDFTLVFRVALPDDLLANTIRCLDGHWRSARIFTEDPDDRTRLAAVKCFAFSAAAA